MEKIEEDNRRQREAERLRELAEKEAADTEHRATLASHARRARMEHVNAANERALQEEVSMHKCRRNERERCYTTRETNRREMSDQRPMHKCQHVL